MQRAHLVSLGFGLALVLAPSVSAANAQIQLGVPGQTTDNQRIDSDPIALSGTLLLGPSNILLTSGSASAAADLTAGTVRVRSTGFTKIDNSGYPTADAHADDKITFHGPGSTVQVRLDVSAEGLFSSSGSGIGYLRQVAQVRLTAGSFNTQALFERDLTTSTTDPPVETFTITIRTPGPDAGFVTTHPVTGTPSAALQIDAAFAVGVPITVAIDASAQAGVSGSPKDFGIDDNFGNTARLTMTLPDGYTFTSESGAFLTQQGAPGLGLPPDGGIGVHGAPGGSPSNDAGAGSGASSSAGGCSAAGSAASASAALVAFAMLAMLRLGRRRRSS